MNTDAISRILDVMQKIRDTLAGMIPGLLLCALVTFWLRVGVAQAVPETYLAMQDITLSGRVTAPSCTVRLDDNQLKFSAPEDGDVTSGTKVGNGSDGNHHDGATQTLRLNVSECDADGVGMLFKADYWPEMPVRGTLRTTPGHQASEALYFTLSPGRESDDTWPLKLARDSEKTEAEKDQPVSDDSQYYRLSEVNYWYDLKKPLRDGDEMVIPLTVTLHQVRMKENKSARGDLEGTFTIQLSWR